MASHRHLHPVEGALSTGFVRFAPPPALAPWLQCTWVFHGHARGDLSLSLCADAGLGLVINLGDPVWLEGAIAPRGIWSDGTSGSAVGLRVSGRVELLGVRFLPGGAQPILGLPAHPLAHGPLDLIAPLGARALWDRLSTLEDRMARVLALEAWLCARRSTPETIAPLHASLRILRRDPGVGIAALADEIGLGRRALERLFRRQVGLSPRVVGRVFRVRQVRARLVLDPLLVLGDLAYEHGFSDQAHLSREFKTMVGATPSAYAARRRRGGSDPAAELRTEGCRIRSS